MSAYIFVSYSRDDEQFVTPIVGILRAAIAGVPSATGKYWEFVFQDVDSIEPGGRWKDQIDAAITRAERMFVFWCEHSSKSLQVEREYKLALSLGQVVVPVLLDDTPLPDLLSPIERRDLRELRTHCLQIRHVFPVPGQRNRHEVIVHAFAQTLEVDPQAMIANLFPSAFGPPV